MKLSRNQLLALGTGLQVGGMVLKGLDADAKGADDRAGQAFTIGGAALSQLASGESVTKKAKAVEALRAIASAVNALADEMEAAN